jgi:hypothetical protein
MTSDRACRLASFTVVGVLAVSMRLPLGWPAWVAATAAMMGLVVVALTTAPDRTSAIAASCVGGIAAVSAGYAAFALVEPGAFGPVTRLGYPLLVATGLRLPGGAALVALSALVALIPVLFPDGDRATPSERIG